MELVEKCDEEGNVLSFILYRGHIFAEGLPKDPETRLDELQKFKCRPDDVVLCSFPKSGLHWVNNIVLMLTTGSSRYKGSPIVPEHHNLRDIEQMDSPRVYAFHTHFELLPKDLQQNKNARIIVIERNPKDVAVSNFFWFSRLTSPLYRGNFDGLLRFFLGDLYFCDTWFTFVKKWYNVRSNHENILYLRFEDLKKDLYGHIVKINNYLGLGRDEKYLREVEQKVSFDTLKREHETKSDVGGDLTAWMNKSAGITPVYRKGKVGDWKNYFTVFQNETFNKIYSEKMAGCDLNFDYE